MRLSQLKFVLTMSLVQNENSNRTSSSYSSFSKTILDCLFVITQITYSDVAVLSPLTGLTLEGHGVIDAVDTYF